MNILEALAQQKGTSTRERIYCDNGWLSISDAVFSVALYKAGYNDIDGALESVKLCDRDSFLNNLNKETMM